MAFIQLKYSRAFFKSSIILFLILMFSFNVCLAAGIGLQNKSFSTIDLQKIIDEINLSVKNKDFDNGILLCQKLEPLLDTSKTDNKLLLSDGFYSIAKVYLITYKYPEAIRYFEKSARYREEAGISDLMYANCITNVGISWYLLGEYQNALKYGKKAVIIQRQLFANDSSSLASYYLNLASITIELNDKKKALEYVEAGLLILKLYPDKVKSPVVADLYQDISVILLRDGENSKALVYAIEALRLYSDHINEKIDSWVLMINSIAIIYTDLNQPLMAEKYLRMGIEYSTPENARSTYLLYMGYAKFLEDRDQFDSAGKILLEALRKIEKGPGTNSSAYALVTSAYASMLFHRDKSVEEATKYYLKCFEYMNSHTSDVIIREYILKQYGSMLYKAKRYTDAISACNMILEPYDIESYASEDIKHTMDRLSESAIGALSIKYKAFNDLAKLTGSKTYTLLAINSGEVLTAIIDNQRLGMSEDESRTSLSDSSRVFYTGLIENYCSLYKSERNNVYLEKAFEFSERSKVAGLLAITRQINATRFSIPPKLSDIDTDLRKKIGLFREYIAKEKEKENPDSNKIARWERNNFKLTRSLDSLVGVFEKEYPAFYKLKYNTHIASIKNVNDVIGPKENLLSYILTDNKLYIFVINQFHKEVIIKDVDMSFHSHLERFREIISTMPSGIDARNSFNEYMYLAHELYYYLIAPAEPFLNGNRLTISPDNILSYIPFESLITSDYNSNDLLYRNAPFLLKKKKLSYIFSVTLASETKDLSLHLHNSVAAFAPTYGNRELSDSIHAYFHNPRGRIPDIPFAKDEALTAVALCGGHAFTGNAATEGVYKREAPEYDIIHMAMHTLINDENPLYSKMIFAESPGAADDGLLNTYEVYNIPLKARMVVLSSCNTGSGKLTSGEGIQSLARGFISSGGKSVIMSMWGVEDYSGAEVIKLFYKNILRGNTKSQALRKARMEFLRNADQRRSHPYYWSTLVVYGDDSPLYYNIIKLVMALAALLMVLGLLVFIVYRDIIS
jgi:CHAT domain-containing protein